MTKNINDSEKYEDENNNFLTTHLTFRLDGQHYGILISNVIEILQIQQATELPELPDYSKGVINLRGRIIPLIDVNLRFGKPEGAYTDRTCIIIVDVDGQHTGLIVDAVEEVLGIDEGITSAPPALYDSHSERYVTRIARIGKTMVFLLDVRVLVPKTGMNIR